MLDAETIPWNLTVGKELSTPHAGRRETLPRTGEFPLDIHTADLKVQIFLCALHLAMGDCRLTVALKRAAQDREKVRRYGSMNHVLEFRRNASLFQASTDFLTSLSTVYAGFL